MLIDKQNSPRFAPEVDAGASTGSPDSLIAPAASTETPGTTTGTPGATTTGATGGTTTGTPITETPGTVDTSKDVFGDLKEFQDPDNQLYLGKYKSINEAMKGHKELQAAYGKAIREKGTPAEVPETYAAITFSKDDHESLDGLEIPADDPLFADMAPFLKEAELSQAQAKTLLKGFMIATSKPLDKAKVMEDLGSQGPAMLAEINGFVGKNFTAEEQELIAEKLGGSAAGLKLAHKLSKMGGERPIPVNGDPARGGSSKEEMLAAAFEYRETHKKTIGYNTAQQATYDRMMREANGFKPKS